MARLILIRHGQSAWNLENRFTGWVDVELTEKGIEEARKTGRALKGQLHPKVAFTSELQRAQKTLQLVMEEAGLKNIPVRKDKALNERHYGDLQGKNKAETAAEFGEEQVHIWRRSFDVPPPNGESLKDTAARTLPYFEKEIVPLLRDNQEILVVAHGNSLRSIVMSVEKMSPEQILKTEIATGEAWIYEATVVGQDIRYERLQPKSKT